MSDELEKKDFKKVTKKRTTPKKIVAKAQPVGKKLGKKVTTKDDMITSEYKYKVTGDEKLIIDKPSTPLIKNETLKENKKKIKKTKSVTTQTNGQIYHAFIKELQSFKLVYNSEVIYDSTLSKNMTNLKFESDHFVLFGKKYSYNGLRVQKN